MIRLEVPPNKSYNDCMEIRDADNLVHDRTEDLYWTIVDTVDEEGKAKLDAAMNEFRDKARTILTDHSN